MSNIDVEVSQIIKNTKNSNIRNITNYILDFIGLNFSSQNNNLKSIDNVLKILISIFIISFFFSIKKNNLNNNFQTILFFIFGIFLFRIFIKYILNDYQVIDISKQNNKIYTITFNQLSFSPKTLSIQNGDIIRFLNKDVVRHTVNFSSNNIASTPLLNPNDSFMIRFKENGVYNFSSIYTENNEYNGKIIVK